MTTFSQLVKDITYVPGDPKDEELGSCQLNECHPVPSADILLDAGDTSHGLERSSTEVALRQGRAEITEPHMQADHARSWTMHDTL